LATAGFNELKIWDAQQDLQTTPIEGSPVSISPDFRWLASAGPDFTVTLWDTLSGTATRTLTGHTFDVRCLAFSPDGSRLASSEGRTGARGRELVVKIWDTQSGQELLTFREHAGDITSVVFSPDGKRLASRGGGIKVWDAQTGKVLHTFQGGIAGPMGRLSFSSDGKRLAAGGRSTYVWDADTGKELFSFTGGGPTVAFSPDDRLLASVNLRGNVIKIWEMQGGQELLSATGSHTDYVSSLIFSPDGKRLISGSRDGMVKVSDALTGQELISFKNHADNVDQLAFQGHRLASTASDGTVQIYDATPLPEKP
jgi:WD40 repeat protein